MANINTTLAALLGPLAAGGAWRITANETPTLPYIIFQNIANTPEVTLADGVPLQNTRVQVDCFARTASEADALAASVDVTLQAAPLKAIPKMTRDAYEPLPQLFRVIQEYSIWY